MVTSTSRPAASWTPSRRVWREAVEVAHDMVGGEDAEDAVGVAGPDDGAGQRDGGGGVAADRFADDVAGREFRRGGGGGGDEIGVGQHQHALGGDQPLQPVDGHAEHAAVGQQ